MFKIAEGSKVSVNHGSEIRTLEGIVQWAEKDRDRGGWAYMVLFGEDMGRVHESEIQNVLVTHLYDVSWVVEGKPGSMVSYDREAAEKKYVRQDAKAEGLCWWVEREIYLWVRLND